VRKTWEEEVQGELDRIQKAHEPGKWSGDRRELEQAYDTLSAQVDEQFKQQQRAFLEGYERREIDARSTETVQKLRAQLPELRPDQQWGSQEAINQAKAAAAQSVAEDDAFQQQKHEAASELGDRHEAMLNRTQEHQRELMLQNGLSDDRLETNLDLAEAYVNYRDGVEAFEQSRQPEELPTSSPVVESENPVPRTPIEPAAEQDKSAEEERRHQKRVHALEQLGSPAMNAANARAHDHAHDYDH